MIGSQQNEWIQFGIANFTDKYPKYTPCDGDFVKSRFALKGGYRVSAIFLKKVNVSRFNILRI